MKIGLETMATVSEMTAEEQIERLVRQRNALWKMLDKIALGKKRDKLWEKIRKVVGNTYVIEGTNFATGDIYQETADSAAAAPYNRARGKPWL